MMFWTAFLLGLAGSLHCVGMCGPLALALPAASASGIAYILGRAAYNAGRIMTYCLLGLVFGLIGQGLLLAGLQRWLSISIGVALIAGLIVSRKARLWKPLLNCTGWVSARMAPLLRRRSVSALLVLGILNGFLPCGLVYVAAAGAAATGDLFSGAAYMALFGLGTTPMMLALALSGKLAPAWLRLGLRKVLPATVVLLAALLILRGLSLGIPYLSPDLAGGGCCSHK
jgi:hypothetical protein